MPIDSLHPTFRWYQEALIDCRNAFDGGRAIKTAGSKYLPTLKDQSNDDYNAYKGRALFFPITSKTVMALVGLAMARPPILKHTAQLNPYFKDRQGAQFLEICSTTLQEVLLMGGYGLFVDAPTSGTPLPQISRYPRESVINWRVDDAGRPTLVVLQEQVQTLKANDPYDSEMKTQYRELFLDGQGVYRVRIWDDKKNQGPVFTPTVRGQVMDHIPFYMINPLGVGMDMIKPPMLDIVDLNISHYRTSADLEHGRHFTGLPTPVVSGIEAGSTLYIGSQKAWILPDPQARAEYLEFTGQGLQSLEKAMQEKQGQMASLSARMIDNSKRGSEAVETVRLRYMSESASLITVVRSTQDGLEQVYAEVASMIQTENPAIDMNKEFMNTKLTAQELTSIVNAYMEGTINQDTLIFNLRRGDVLSPHDSDQEVKDGLVPPGTGSKPKPGNTGAQ